jgi:hypothetical protein
MIFATRRRTNCDQKYFPDNDHGIDLILMHAIENRYAAFSEVLLEGVLVPYWKAKRSGLVASEGAEAPPDAHKEASEEPRPKPNADAPSYIRLAEEFIGIR